MEKTTTTKQKRPHQARAVAQLHSVAEEEGLEVLGLAGRAAYGHEVLIEEDVDGGALADVGVAHLGE